MTDIRQIRADFQKVGNESFEAVVRSYSEARRGFQILTALVTENVNKAVEASTRAFEQLLGAKSFEQVVEIQSQYAKRAYDNYVAEAPKLGELYVSVVREASKPFEQAFPWKAGNGRGA
jgi:hypothetical protein